jgi:rubrerythrin
MLEEAMNGEAGAIQFYSRLRAAAPTDFGREQIEMLLEDEQKHLRNFQELCARLTGHAYRPTVKPEEFSSWEEGVAMAWRDQMEAAEMYRDMQLMVCQPWIRDVLFDAMTDEMEHAGRLTYITALMPR